MHVAEAGQGDPVLLLHGFPQNWWEWRGVIPGLAQNHRVIVPDLRGTGWTDVPTDGVRARPAAGRRGGAARRPRDRPRPRGRARLGCAGRLPPVLRASRAGPELPVHRHPAPVHPFRRRGRCRPSGICGSSTSSPPLAWVRASCVRDVSAWCVASSGASRRSRRRGPRTTWMSTPLACASRRVPGPRRACTAGSSCPRSDVSPSGDTGPAIDDADCHPLWCRRPGDAGRISRRVRGQRRRPDDRGCPGRLALHPRRAAGCGRGARPGVDRPNVIPAR